MKTVRREENVSKKTFFLHPYYDEENPKRENAACWEIGLLLWLLLLTRSHHRDELIEIDLAILIRIDLREDLVDLEALVSQHRLDVGVIDDDGAQLVLADLAVT